MIPQSYYVDVNINYKKTTPLVGSVPMSVLISKTATSTKEYTSLQQVSSDYSEGNELLAATIYFGSGGTDLLIYQQASSSSDTDTLNALINEYPNFVWVSFLEYKTIQELQTISKVLSTANQGYTKFLAASSSIVDAPVTLSGQGVSNIALLKMPTGQPSDTADIYQMMIPAYFSGINLSSVNSIKSMVFTRMNTGDEGVAISGEVTPTQLTELYEKNWNILVNLGGRYTVLDGGKMVDGQPIHSAWGFSIFKKNCENVVTDLLVNKLPYENSSNAVIENVLSGVCNQFVTNGLIGTDKTYTQPDESVTYNGITYDLIRNGQVLNSGYLIFSIPISNASNADKEIGKIPPIYIYAIINDAIRLVEITGEVTK